MKLGIEYIRGGLFILLLALLLVVPARGQVNLSFTPADTILALGEMGRLSIIIAESVEVRSIDVTVTYDSTVVRSMGGSAGSLYTDSGIFTFKGFEEEVLGTWHGYAVLMGAELFIEGPGELYYWDFEGLADGVTPIISVSAYVSTTDGSWFADVQLPATSVTVGDPLSSVQDIPSLEQALKIWPNPFNPRTEVGFDLTHDSWVHLAVFDARGRRVVVLQDGYRAAGPINSYWDGRDSSGQNQPGGVYFFTLRTDYGVTSTKGVLLK